MRYGFTIVELLVVITILVVLLALLAPALDQAIYQAELAVCGSRLKGIANGANVYAMEQRRAYPTRPGVDDANIDYYPMQLTFESLYDLRPMIAPYIQVRDMLLCPLVPKIDLTVPASGTYIYSPYNLWFGWQYAEASGMHRLGDHWEGFPANHPRNPARLRFNWIAGDGDRHGPPARAIYGSHPDRLGSREGKFYPEVAQNVPIAEIAGGLVQTRWRSREGDRDRGLIDMNHAAADGSVVRFTDLEKYDARLADVPDNARNNRTGADKNTSWFTHVPRH